MAWHGWIKKHRKVMDSLVWTDPYKYKLFDMLTMLAQFDDGVFQFNGEEIAVSSGQIVTGRDALAFLYNRGAKPVHQMSSRNLWRMIKNFEKDGMLSIKSTTKYSVITVINYDYYQSSVQQPVQQSASNLSSNLSTYKNTKTIKNDEEIVVSRQPDRVAGTNAFGKWQEVWGFPNGTVQGDLFAWREEFGDDLVTWAIDYAARRDVKAAGANRYIERMMDRYREQGIKTVQQAEEEAEKHAQVARANAPRRGKGSRVEKSPAWLDQQPEPVAPQQTVSQEKLDAQMAELQRLTEKRKEGSE